MLIDLYTGKDPVLPRRDYVIVRLLISAVIASPAAGLLSVILNADVFLPTWILIMLLGLCQALLQFYLKAKP